MTIRILIADDHPIVRSGVKAELSRQADLEIVGEAVTGDQTFEMTKRLTPDILLLDISMPGMRTTEVICRIHQIQLPVRILVLSAYGDNATVSGILRVGVEGYLLKDEDPRLIPDAIRTLAKGQKWLSPSVTQFLMENAQLSDNQAERPVLSEKETNILQLISQGHITKEIALTLSIGERTVEYHIRNIFRKMNVNSRAQAVLWARDHGVL